MAIKIGETADTIEVITAKITNLQNASGNSLTGWELLESSSIASSVASKEIDVSGYSGTYKVLRITCFGLTTVTDNVTFGVYSSADGGSTYLSSYRNVIGRSTDAGSTWTYSYNAARTSGEMMQGTGNDAFAEHHFEGYLYRYDQTNDAMFFARSVWWADDTAPNQSISTTTWSHAAVMDTLKFQASSGNIDGGDFYIWGLKAAP